MKHSDPKFVWPQLHSCQAQQSSQTGHWHLPIRWELFISPLLTSHLVILDQNTTRMVCSYLGTGFVLNLRHHQFHPHQKMSILTAGRNGTIRNFKSLIWTCFNIVFSSIEINKLTPIFILFIKIKLTLPYVLKATEPSAGVATPTVGSFFWVLTPSAEVQLDPGLYNRLY